MAAAVTNGSKAGWAAFSVVSAATAYAIYAVHEYQTDTKAAMRIGVIRDIERENFRRQREEEAAAALAAPDQLDQGPSATR